VVRFPGGCFADSYDWKDGIGPADKRPRRTNFWEGEESPNAPASHKYDPNQFGTNEFIRFCKLIDSEPYLAGNVRSLTAQDFYRWIEYCNSAAGSTTLADMRAAAGFPEPFNVRYWGVGRELGMRRKLHGAGIRRRISPLDYLGAALPPGHFLHRLWSECG
jgi:alpha-N-arabinofuranosidase